MVIGTKFPGTVMVLEIVNNEGGVMFPHFLSTELKRQCHYLYRSVRESYNALERDYATEDYRSSNKTSHSLKVRTTQA